ncbi:hypothetical protein BOTBODRAFT_182474 [Botryobasidium botryosum FD-172 SS1]|uniref:Uncharacterized protein n=1 Tax=Botryobasidium botryosum (strain FD-172 SS1) TaxID=930990 RepID=A0A067LQN6_BOTB1|nr:hypothetical protein BOTBODRAFT_182474 [Botryobasidium botryosum FD-172 SS1]
MTAPIPTQAASSSATNTLKAMQTLISRFEKQIEETTIGWASFPVLQGKFDYTLGNNRPIEQKGVQALVKAYTEFGVNRNVAPMILAVNPSRLTPECLEKLGKTARMASKEALAQGVELQLRAGDDDVTHVIAGQHREAALGVYLDSHFERGSAEWASEAQWSFRVVDINLITRAESRLALLDLASNCSDVRTPATPMEAWIQGNAFYSHALVLSSQAVALALGARELGDHSTLHLLFRDGDLREAINILLQLPVVKEQWDWEEMGSMVFSHVGFFICHHLIQFAHQLEQLPKPLDEGQWLTGALSTAAAKAAADVRVQSCASLHHHIAVQLGPTNRLARPIVTQCNIFTPQVAKVQFKRLHTFHPILSLVGAIVHPDYYRSGPKHGTSTMNKTGDLGCILRKIIGEEEPSTVWMQPLVSFFSNQEWLEQLYHDYHNLCGAMSATADPGKTKGVGDHAWPKWIAQIKDTEGGTMDGDVAAAMSLLSGKAGPHHAT